MEVMLDARAQHLLARGRPGQGMLITIVGNYGLPGAMIMADWCRADDADRDPDLVRLDVQEDIPIYAHRRVAAYARWHTVALTARNLTWWPSFAVVHANETWRDLLRWERTHPGLCATGHGNPPRPTRGHDVPDARAALVTRP